MTNAELARAVAEAAGYTISEDGEVFADDGAYVGDLAYRKPAYSAVPFCPYEDLNQAFAAAARVFLEFGTGFADPLVPGTTYAARGITRKGRVEVNANSDSPARAICLAIVEAPKNIA